MSDKKAKNLNDFFKKQTTKKPANKKKDTYKDADDKLDAPDYKPNMETSATAEETKMDVKNLKDSAPNYESSDEETTAISITDA